MIHSLLFLDFWPMLVITLIFMAIAALSRGT